jgi:hypothetical protein
VVSHTGKDETMLKELKDLTNSHPVPSRTENYVIIRYHHPDGGSRTELIKEGLSLAQAQAYCQDPATSCKDGPTSNWWFDGYVEANSNTKYILLWKAFT